MAENCNAQKQQLDMAKCLMLLSHSFETKPQIKKRFASDVFECKTCNRQFPSFQALGGHRASHKRPRLMGEYKLDGGNKSLALTMKPKLHECSICGQEFALGQALGGHMRRHRVVMNESSKMHNDIVVSKMMPVVMRRNNSMKRVFGLDLNLTPLENDLQFLFGKMAPKVDLCM